MAGHHHHEQERGAYQGFDATETGASVGTGSTTSPSNLSRTKADARKDQGPEHQGRAPFQADYSNWDPQTLVAA